MVFKLKILHIVSIGLLEGKYWKIWTSEVY
jgi:hypothetical protein